MHLPDLTVARFRFTLQAVDVLTLPDYKGSTLRGGFGHSFRKVVCTMGPIPCATCLLHFKCPYPRFFETPVSEKTPPFMRGVKTGPQPFVLEPPLENKRIYQSGEKLEFILILIGRAIEYLSYFVYAFYQLGVMGIGRGKGKFRLQQVDFFSEGWQTVYTHTTQLLSLNDTYVNSRPAVTENATAKQVILTFLTPTRIKVKGHLTTEISFRELTVHLLRRVNSLAYFHTKSPTIVWDWQTVLEAADNVSLKNQQLQWVDWERYSNRQKTRMKLGGFVGEMTFSGDLGQFIALLQIGELVHVGKGATFGLGKYKMRFL